MMCTYNCMLHSVCQNLCKIQSYEENVITSESYSVCDIKHTEITCIACKIGMACFNSFATADAKPIVNSHLSQTR